MAFKTFALFNGRNQTAAVIFLVLIGKFQKRKQNESTIFLAATLPSEVMSRAKWQHKKNSLFLVLEKLATLGPRFLQD
jgi:hypothetical protein